MHINNLRLYQDREAETAAEAYGARPGATPVMINDCEMLDWKAELITSPMTDDGNAHWQRVQLGEELNDDQQDQLQRLLSEYPDVLLDRPGCTHLIEHSIKLNDTTPVYQTSYRVPDSLKEAVEKELMSLLKDGIISYENESSYNSPLIVVRKSNNQIRIVQTS